MAEIRKYDPAAGNAIAQALKAAMGDPVRPNQPGSTPPERTEVEPPASTKIAWLSVQIQPDEDD